MNIDIKNLDEQQLLDLQSQIEEQLSKPKYPPKGTICEVWDRNSSSPQLRYYVGNGNFTYFSTGDMIGSKWDNYRVVSQGLQFSDNVIHSEDITPEMDKTLCLVWDGKDMPDVRAIDSKNKSAYRDDGSRRSIKWDSYRLCTTPYELMPQWAKDIIDKLEE